MPPVAASRKPFEVAQPLALVRQVELLGIARRRRVDLREPHSSRSSSRSRGARALLQHRQLLPQRAARECGREAGATSACSGPQNPSRISSRDAASVSLRCSCCP